MNKALKMGTSKQISWLALITIIQLNAYTSYQIPQGIPYPVAYNLHSQAVPRDINELENDHVKRAMLDIKQTITEVQKLLQSDPTLPRLTRGEIEELFENVTREEFERSLSNGDQDRAKHMKALMLVLPYNTADNASNQNLQDLYTRAPLTKLVTNGVKKTNYIKDEILYPESGKVQIVAQSLSERRPTTYRPKLHTNPTKPQKPTTFHPKMITSSEEVIIPYANIPKTKNKPEKFHSRYSGETSSEESVEHPKITKHVKGMLASIGLYSDEVEISTTALPTTTTSTPKVPELTPELKELLESFGLLKDSDSSKKYKLEDSKPFMSSMIRDDSFKVGEFKPLPETLRAEDFRMNFNSPDVRSNDYSSFKPLPIPEDSPKAFTNEMADFLKSFGLFDNSRGKKSIGKKSDKVAQEIPKIDSESLPSKMASTLDHMGMSKRSDTEVFENIDLPHSERLIGLEEIELTTKKEVSGSFESFEIPSPVFIPSNHKSDSKEKEPRKLEQPKLFLLTNNSYSDEDDYQKLHQLLETIKQLDNLNANLTEEEISKLELKNYNLSDALLAQGPNPLDNIEIDSAKNEVKRQDSKEAENPTRISLGLDQTNPFGSITTIEEELIKTTKNGPLSTLEYTGTLDTNTDFNSPEIVLPETTSTTTTTTETPTTSTTEESRKASIEDLEDSFAGGADPVTEEPLPPPRRNGFYFLADWNSFLEVGEDPDKIIVRFDPKIGDPSRFLPVTVP